MPIKPRGRSAGPKSRRRTRSRHANLHGALWAIWTLQLALAALVARAQPSQPVAAPAPVEPAAPPQSPAAPAAPASPQVVSSQPAPATSTTEPSAPTAQTAPAAGATVPAADAPPSAAQVPRPSAAATAASAAQPPVRTGASQSQDFERPPEVESPHLGPEPNTFAARLAIGVAVSLLTLDGEAALQTPPLLSLDLGYAPARELVLWLRLQSWLAYDQYGFQFIGAGVSYLDLDASMFVTGLLGVSIADDEIGLPFGDGDRVQGLTAQVEIAQQWSIAAALTLEVGVHFELVTPWLGDAFDAAAISIGPFLAIGAR